MTDHTPSPAPDSHAPVDLSRLPRRARALLEVASLLDPEGFPAEVLTGLGVLDVAPYLREAPGQPRPVARRILAALRPKGSDARTVQRAFAQLVQHGHLVGDPSSTVRVPEAARRAALAALAGDALTFAAGTAADALDGYWSYRLDLNPTAPEHPGLDPVMLANTAALSETAGDILVELSHDLLFQFGHRLRATRRPVEEEADYWRRLAAEFERLQGPDTDDALGAREQLAGAYIERGGREEAETAVELYDALLADRHRVHEPGHEETFATAVNRGAALALAGRAEEAVAALQKVATEAADRGAGWPTTSHVRDRLALAHRLAGRPETALSLLQEAVGTEEEAHGRFSRPALEARLALAGGLREAERKDEAADAYRAVLHDVRARYDSRNPEHPMLIGRAESALAELGSPAFEE
ncbi:tetratricopeptide repeat protein [Streptomonospora litoralis]|uniref:Tetratricopeptide repeat protein n=1 Tax=Streptomonospora litoralis TaxID=2498135 RepID=A0A4P6PXM4_9ACTN|nr:tetratricopeptide repeat protein [Streptomonospora litoralis]QBI52885.1 hypothetical protein EKD16_05395 [Streptomonospora litoralis]